ncbi:hypothetical protein NE237_006791 [Protea cynaroides]|uniref:Uncharacterized protein n=1 Tax=Protea cynaroides TaxID=273540 RepID=A0A9Q0QVS6_9MAGN|nr:hypothetical protein NE237_006791 [Protea cynaroides]
MKVIASPQIAHCHVNIINNNQDFWCSAVYVANALNLRGSLWNTIESLVVGINRPWILMGDFNIVRNNEEKVGGGSFFTFQIQKHSMRVYRQLGQKMISCKLGKALVNALWVAEFQGLEATILPPGISDHCPVAVILEEPLDFGLKPFKIFNT